MPPPEVVAAYDAPFPDDSYKAGARDLPDAGADLARRPGQRRQRRGARGPRAPGRSRSSRSFSDSDPITGGGERWFQEHVPGAAGQPHTTIVGGGHFLQEDQGPELARQLVAFVG